MAVYECSALSERGNPSSNDDFVEVDAELAIFVIADGMGGRAAGAKASRTAVSTFTKRLRKLDSASRMKSSVLREALYAANMNIYSAAESDPLLAGMGTTLSALVVGDNGKGTIVHVGDSRIYLFRNNTLRLLTKDHTLVAELVEHNHISDKAAEKYPLRNVLSRCVGTQTKVEPDIVDVDLEVGDLILLATDGLSKALKEQTLETIIRKRQDASVDVLCEAVMKSAIQNYSDDNITVAVIKVKD